MVELGEQIVGDIALILGDVKAVLDFRCRASRIGQKANEFIVGLARPSFHNVVHDGYAGPCRLIDEREIFFITAIVLYRRIKRVDKLPCTLPAFEIFKLFDGPIRQCQSIAPYQQNKLSQLS